MSKEEIQAVFRIPGHIEENFDIERFGWWDFQLFAGIRFSINAKLALPFPRKNVFCLCFQRKIKFVGNQGLDFLNNFHCLLPSRDPISQKRKPIHSWNLVKWSEPFCRSSSHQYSYCTNVHLAASLVSCFRYSHLSFKIRWNYRTNICASLKAKQSPNSDTEMF